MIDKSNKYKGEQIGWFLWKRQWYSFCSRHGVHDDNCRACNTGHYVWLVEKAFSRLLRKCFPYLWLRWINRKKVRKRLESVFPNLKKK